MNIDPPELLRRFWPQLLKTAVVGSVLDLASGDCHGGIFLACDGAAVTCCDRSSSALARAEAAASQLGVAVRTWELDLEKRNTNPLPVEAYAGILIFRYLHRPLIPAIRKALLPGGFLMYETFTLRQPAFGKPHNPDHLLKSGELLSWFHDWQVLHFFEGIQQNPQRAVAQLVCRKP